MMEVISQSESTRGTLPPSASRTSARDDRRLGQKNTASPSIAIVWQCRRTAPICDELEPRAQGLSSKRRRVWCWTRIFPALKIKWILDNVPGAQEKAEAWRSFCSARSTPGSSGSSRTGRYISPTTQTPRARCSMISTTLLGRTAFRNSGLDAACGAQFLRVYGTCNIQGRAGADRGHCGRPAGGAVRSVLLYARRREKHVRHGLLLLMNTGETAMESARTRYDDCGRPKRTRAVCARGLDFLSAARSSSGCATSCGFIRRSPGRGIFCVRRYRTRAACISCLHSRASARRTHVRTEARWSALRVGQSPSTSSERAGVHCVSVV